jgi:hypothetical protein
MQRLKRAGFSADFVRAAILPDWWDDSCADDVSVLQDIEIRVARFLERPITSVSDSGSSLAPVTYPAAQLRRVRDINRDRLAAAIHASMRVAAAVARNLRASTGPSEAPLPTDGLSWREQISRAGAAPALTDIASDLWRRGIPVVSLAVLPAPYFQGMACIVEGRPVILLGYKHDEPGRVAFVVAHEAGHIAAGDCAPDQPVVDEEDEISDDADVERRADQYATSALVGGLDVPAIEGVDSKDFKDLARRASHLERTAGADASSVIFAWARRSGDYATATMAVKALYRHTGATRQLHKLFSQHVDFDNASETDRVLLMLCVRQ